MNNDLTNDDLDAAGLSDEEREALGAEVAADPGAGAAAGESAGEAGGEAWLDAGEIAAKPKDAPREDLEGDPGKNDGGDAAAADPGSVPPETQEAAGEAQPPEAVAAGDRAYDPEDYAAAIPTKAAPENYEDRMKEFDARRRELTQKYEDGDIGFSEYESARSELDEERFDLKAQQREHVASVEAASAQAKAAWESAQEKFFAVKENKIFQDNEVALASLNQTLRGLSQAAENANRSAKWFLEEAARITKAEIASAFGITPQAPAAAKPPTGSGKAPPAPSAKAPQKEIPPNIGDMPAAQAPSNTDGGEFAHLEGLSGLDLERAIAAMTPEQELRYSMPGS